MTKDLKFNEVWEEYKHTITNRNEYIKTMCEMFYTRGHLEGELKITKLVKQIYEE